eukprot:88644_1
MHDQNLLLTVPCIGSLLIVVITTVMKANHGIPAGVLLMDGLIITSGNITNFLSIFLGFSAFDGYYMVICGSCHRTCLECGDHAAATSDVGQLSKTIDTTSASKLESQLRGSANRANYIKYYVHIIQHIL